MNRITDMKSKAPRNLFAGSFLVGSSVILAFMSGYNWFSAFSAQKEIDFRKKQLQRPVVKLSEEDMINPPWNNSNINDWLYRRGITISKQFS